MTHFALPTIRGTIEQQLKQIVGYLTDQAEKLNYNLDNSSAEKIFEQAAAAVTSSDDKTDDEVYDKRYVALKSLIIKTADEVVKSGDVKSLTLNGSYVAKSEYGEFVEQTKANFTATSNSITQTYNYASQINTNLEVFKTDYSHYVKTGYLETVKSSPIFGIEVGLLSGSFTYMHNDEEYVVINDKPHKIRITPSELSLFSNGYKAAWISEKAIYFPNANITGGTIDIASGTFKVDNKGAVTATSGLIGGWHIDSRRIYSNESAYEVALCNFINNETESRVLYCRVGTDGDYTFKLLRNGFLYATNVELSGKITATSGTIGGWDIDAYGITSTKSDYTVAIYNYGNDGNESRVLYCLDTNKSSYTFKLLRNGFLYATNVELSGKITATSGSIGGWDIDATRIYSTKSRYEVALCNFNNNETDSRVLYCLDTNKSEYTFKLLRNGFLYATNVDLSGKITAIGGTIGGWKIDSSTLYVPKTIKTVTVGSETKVEVDRYGTGMAATSSSNAVAFWAGYRGRKDSPFSINDGITDSTDMRDWRDYTDFYVTNTGYLYAKNAEIYGSVYASGGRIGGWYLGPTDFYTNNNVIYTQSTNYEVGLKGSSGENDAAFYVKKRSNGDVVFAVQNNGCLTAMNAVIYGTVYASDGKIGGWYLGPTDLYKNDKVIYTQSTNYEVGLKGSSGENDAAFYVKKRSNGDVVFAVQNNGCLTAMNAVIYGSVYASAGKIGGWYLGPTDLYKNDNVIYTQSSTYEVGMKGSSGENDAAFYVKKRSNGDVVFAVQNNGCLTAMNAVIYGTVYASDGKIGGWYLGPTDLYKNDKVIYTQSTNYEVGLKGTSGENDAAFYVKKRSNGDVVFAVQNNGCLTANNAVIYGTVYASGGTIGGWNIGKASLLGSTAIYSTVGNYEIGMQASSNENNVAFYVKHKTAGDKFYIKNNGTLYASNAEIHGTVYATSGSFTGSIYASGGTIGGFDIHSYYIVTSSKTWGNNGSLLLCPTGSSNDDKKEIGGSGKRSGWVITAGSKFGVDKDGYMFCSGASVNEALFGGETYFGGNLNIYSHMFTSTETIYAWAYYDSNDHRLSYKTWASVGTVSNEDAFYVGVPDWIMRLNGKAVQLKDGTAVTSDARLKTEIQTFSEAHEDFFMMLSPKTYKYIEGTSDRTHFGFIAQEMETAILESGLTTQDVAAFVSIASDRDGFEGYELSIRYSEIVALNTYMIQKCLNKIKALEDEIIILKNERNV